MKRTIPLLVGAAMLVTIPSLAQGRGGFGPGFGPGMHGGGPGGGRLGCVVQALNLDDSQQAAWEQIQTNLHDTMQGLAQQRRDLGQQLRDAVAADNPDATAIGQLMISQHQIGTQMQAAHEKARTDLEALLTPDQLTQFQQLSQLQQACGRRGGSGGPGGAKGLRGPGPGCPYGPGGGQAPN